LGLNPGPPPLEASTLQLGYRGGGSDDVNSDDTLSTALDL